ncbi:structural maintenance of chromosomes 5 smc5 [Diplocarpon rosae]|nr:structural maintenance of chromosomes 5 smc5 [Diplocarpon rosae]
MSAGKGRRRPRSDTESEDGDDDTRRAQSSTRSESSKRARTNGYHGDSSAESSEIEDPHSNGFGKGQANMYNVDSNDGLGNFQPGAIIRVKLKNFVTYESAEFFPGPSMNMVIGPNGTGKSSLVCAICIGLGYPTSTLGRGKDFGEYVKDKSNGEAFIEIELCKRPDEPENHVIRLRIMKAGSTRDWWLNGRKTSMKAVQKLVKDLSIQIDNLCQFLPQEQVATFASLSPVAILEETQRAAAPPEMLEMHEQLKGLRKSQKGLDIQLATDRETLENWEKRQESLQIQVQKLQERLQIEEKIKHLERTIPFVEYRDARIEHQVRSRTKKEAQQRVRELEAQVQPTLERINAKQEYLKQISEIVKERKIATNGAERQADAKSQTLDKVDEEIKDKEGLMEAQKKARNEQKHKVGKLQKIVTDLKAKLHGEAIVFDPTEWNDRIRTKEHELQDLKAEAEELVSRENEIKDQGRAVSNKRAEAERSLAAFDTQEGQQMSKLAHESRDTAEAWKWVQEHRDEFQAEIYGPPLITCSLKDPRYANAVEATLKRTDFLTFVTQNSSDSKKLSNQLGKFKDITIREADGARTESRLLSEQEMQQLGLDAWAIDLVDGPGPVLSFLESRGLDRSAVALQDITDDRYNYIKEKTKLTQWATNNNSYRIQKREEYGPSATSSTSRQVNAARYWTDQPADTSGKREIREKIAEIESEFEDLKQQILPLRATIKQLREKGHQLQKEIAAMKEEKAELQTAFNEQRNLPGKIKRAEDALGATDSIFVDIQNEMARINAQHDAAVLQKVKLALEYKDLVSHIRSCHEALLEAQIRAIEAESDVVGLQERNSGITSQVDEERRRMNEAHQELAEFKAIATRARDAVAALQADPENEQYRDGWANLAEDLTVEQLQNDISAEKVKLQFTHADNPDAVRQFDQRQKDIERLQQKIDDVSEKLEKTNRRIIKIRGIWEPRLDSLIVEISDAFSHNFEQIGCAGEVAVHKDDDFDLWSVQIKVKFREKESLQILDAHRQSGGERSVSTIFYLLSLQALAQAPFRVVDEINQGMDPRNERMVHERMVEIACKEHTSQYFLITPKLLTGLRYDRRMKVLCIASGAWMPTDYKKLDVNKIIGIKRGLMASAAG